MRLRDKEHTYHHVVVRTCAGTVHQWGMLPLLPAPSIIRIAPSPCIVRTRALHLSCTAEHTCTAEAYQQSHGSHTHPAVQVHAVQPQHAYALEAVPGRLPSQRRRQHRNHHLVERVGLAGLRSAGCAGEYLETEIEIDTPCRRQVVWIKGVGGDEEVGQAHLLYAPTTEYLELGGVACFRINSAFRDHIDTSRY